MKNLIVALAAVALIGGCMKVSTAPPKDLPEWVKVYPGAQQVVSVNMGPISSLAFQAPAAPADVVAYYRNGASSDGLIETPMQADASGPVKATFRNAAGDEFLTVVAQPQGAGSMVSLAYKAPKAPS
jgi:hypothetical protein